MLATHGSHLKYCHCLLIPVCLSMTINKVLWLCEMEQSIIFLNVSYEYIKIKYVCFNDREQI